MNQNINISFDEYEDMFNSEIGHARFFVEYKKEDIYLSSSSGQGYYFDQTTNLWQKKQNSEFIHLVAEFLELQIKQVISILAKSRNKPEKLIEATKILKKVRTHKHADSVWKLSRTNLVKVDFSTQMNRAPHLLPLTKGRVIDLKTLEVRLRKKTDCFDFEINAEFTKDTSHASAFFSSIMNNKADVVSYLQYNLGYMLTAETRERCIYIFWGAGKNGKSTVMNIMKKVLGKLQVTTDKKVFIKTEVSSSHTSHLIPLIGARLAVFSESSKSEKLNEDLIKSLTGNDEISARELYGSQFTFTPKAKYVILTNHKPTFDTSDQAMIDRVRYIPFTARFTLNPVEGEQIEDPEVVENITSEYFNEVFSWLCIGANKFYNTKLVIPKSVKEATDSYLKELDNVTKFIEETCTSDTKVKIKHTLLFDRYKSYCMDNGFTYLRNTDFYKRIEAAGYQRTVSMGYTYFVGLQINNFID